MTHLTPSASSAWSSPTFYTLAFPTLIFPGVLDDSQDRQQVPQFSEGHLTSGRHHGHVIWEFLGGFILGLPDQV